MGLDSTRVAQEQLNSGLLQPIHAFLYCVTPARWIEQAQAYPDELLIDHANCEKKAASTALNLIYRYISYPDLLHKLSRLAREELRHFEQVLVIMQQRNIDYVYVSPSRYASGLRAQILSSEPDRLIDTLIVGAIIEARSCERFAALIPALDNELADFYASLLKSEARHYADYLGLAKRYHSDEQFPDNFEQRVNRFLELEAELVNSVDTEFRFHSGPLE